MPQCERCETDLESKGGLLAAVGLTSEEGYECSSCGVLLCTECYRKRKIELRGASHDNCPVCDAPLEKR